MKGLVGLGLALFQIFGRHQPCSYESKDEPASVLLEDYAVDPAQKPTPPEHCRMKVQNMLWCLCCSQLKIRRWWLIGTAVCCAHLRPVSSKRPLFPAGAPEKARPQATFFLDWSLAVKQIVPNDNEFLHIHWAETILAEPEHLAGGGGEDWPKKGTWFLQQAQKSKRITHHGL